MVAWCILRFGNKVVIVVVLVFFMDNRKTGLFIIHGFFVQTFSLVHPAIVMFYTWST